MLCYNLLELTCKFSMEQQVFYMQYGFSVCNTGFLCSYRVIYKQVGSSMQPAGHLCAMRVFYTSCASFVCNAGLLCSLRLSVELVGFLCSLRVFCVAYGLLYALKGVYVANGFSMQPAENLNIFNVEPFRAIIPDFFAGSPIYKVYFCQTVFCVIVPLINYLSAIFC